MDNTCGLDLNCNGYTSIPQCSTLHISHAKISVTCTSECLCLSTMLFKQKSFLTAKLSPSPSLSWAELAIFPINPDIHQPTTHHPPTRTSLDFMFRAILRKQKLLVYSHKPQKCFWTSPRPQK